MRIKGLQDVDELRRRAGIPEQPPRMISAKTFVEQRGQGSVLEQDWGPRWLQWFPHLQFRAQYVFSPVYNYRWDFCFPDEGPDVEPRQSKGGVAVELHGSIHKGAGGDHTSFKGITRDCQKSLHGIECGWVVIALTPEMSRDVSVLTRIAEIIETRREKRCTDPGK